MKESETIELKNEPGVKFREVAEIFITPFSRPSFSEEKTVTGEVTPPVTPQVTPQVTPPVKKLLKMLEVGGELGDQVIREGLNLKDRTHAREFYINPALESGLIEMIIPDKPTSRLQKYRLTERGREVL